MRHPVTAQLERRKRGTLIARTRLIYPHVHCDSRVVGHVDRGQRRSPIHARQPARIAMRKDVDGATARLSQLANDLEAVHSNRATLLHIRVANRTRFPERDLWAPVGGDSGDDAAHSFERPGEVHSRGASLSQRLDRFFQMAIGGIRAQCESQSVGSRRADERRTANHHGADCLCGVSERVQIDCREFEGQPRLIDDPHGPRGGRPEGAIVRAGDFHRDPRLPALAGRRGSR